MAEPVRHCNLCMMTQDRIELRDALDDATLYLSDHDAHLFLFHFSLTVLEKLFPEFAGQEIAFSQEDLISLRDEHKGKKPVDIFPTLDGGAQSKASLLINLYQAIQENSDSFGVGGLVYGLWETLEREGFSQLAINAAFFEGIRSWESYREMYSSS